MAATYQHPLGDSLMLRTNVSAKYSSHFNTGSDLNPLKDQKAMTLVNALVSVGA